jgi:hypothetical protein
LKHFSHFVFIISIVFSSSVFANENVNLSKIENKVDNVSIIVSSTDKYAELWDPFFKLLFNQWASLNTVNADLPIYLISNNKIYENARIQNINIPQEKSWSDNILVTLNEVKTDYVIILLEDFFINHLDEKRMADILKTAQDNKVVYIQLTDHGPEYTTGGKYEKLDGLFKKAKHDDFRTSLSACLWRTDDLRFLLKSGENPWEFESAPGNSRSQGMRGDFLQVLENPPLVYLNMAFRGHLVNENVQKAKSELGITIGRGILPLDSEHRVAMWFKIDLPQHLYWRGVVPIKKFFLSLFS